MSYCRYEYNMLPIIDFVLSHHIEKMLNKKCHKNVTNAPKGIGLA